MPRYITTARAAPAAFAGMLKSPSNREEVLAPLYAAKGITLEHWYMSPDTMEIIAIVSGPDMAAADGLALLVASSGMLDLSTYSVRRILNGPELAATARAADASVYRPPGG